jgi:acetyl-CoA carboxylase biotin carboxyl carrier protein
MDLREIQDFIKAIAKSGISEVQIETESLKLRIKTQPKEKPALATETTYVQQYPVQSHLATMPPFQMVTGLPTQVPVHATKETEIKQEEPEKKLLEIKAPDGWHFLQKTCSRQGRLC